MAWQHFASMPEVPSPWHHFPLPPWPPGQQVRNLGLVPEFYPGTSIRLTSAHYSARLAGHRMQEEAERSQLAAQGLDVDSFTGGVQEGDRR